ncbi:MAG: RNA polymerase sigma factor [Candidatus Promineifilaceae bacterium]|jgi:RNA polymerase sigma factor (sigma-70 family)
MIWEEQALAAALQQAIQSVAAQNGKALARTITPIILANMDRGRVHNFLDGQENGQPEEYVWRVLAYYQKWQPYLAQIQEERQPDLWQPLYEKLKRWAYNYLFRKNFHAAPDVKVQMAADCAVMAATKLLNARFPYDTDFDPWAYVLVQNVTLKHLHKTYQDAAANWQQVDNWEEWENVLPGLTSQGHRNIVELRQALITTIDQLASDARKQIIVLHYFDGLPLYEIAQIMGRSDNATHKLHFDALQNLRKIWDGSWDNYG